MTDDKVGKVEQIKKNAIIETAPIDPVDLKNAILSYLQEKKYELLKTVPGLRAAAFEDDPPRIILDMPEGIELPVLFHSRYKLPVDYKTKGKQAVIVNEDKEGELEVKPVDMSDDVGGEIYQRALGGEAAKSLGIHEALGPHSMQESSNSNAKYDEWIKRHPIVKIDKSAKK